MNVQPGRKIFRSEPQQRTNSLRSKHQPKRHSNEGKRQALGKHLARQPPWRAAERGAYGKLLRAARGASQQESSDIRTRNQKNQADRSQKDKQWCAHVPINELSEGNVRTPLLILLGAVSLVHLI